MSFRVPILRVAATVALATLSTSGIRAQDAAADEVKFMRRMIEQQGKQIELLTAQVAQLSAKIEGGGKSPAPAPAPAPEAKPAPAEGSAEFSAPAARVVAPPAAVNVHVVVKGESLAKIALVHGTTIVELQKLNRIRDAKKIQIGQQIKLPPQPPQKEAH